MENHPVKTGYYPRLQWALIALFFITTLFTGFWRSDAAVAILPPLVVFAVFTASWLHGVTRYGIRNMLVFFAITWLVSHFSEALSIQTGFPFGYYHYDALEGPRLFQVPLVIMFAYFGTGYASWMLATILTGQFDARLQGKYLWLVPLTAAFIMVMWDLCMDPVCSTVGRLWVWHDGGAYFGVPLQNYFGWFLVVFVIYRIFALWINRQDHPTTEKRALFQGKAFWAQVVCIYAIQTATWWIEALGADAHQDIYYSMALIAVFTMFFVVVMALVGIARERG